MPRTPIGRVLLPGLALLATATSAEPLDEALYARLLERYTKRVEDTAGTRVDYPGLAASAEWRRLVGNVGRTDPAALPTRDAKLAYWINVYNILAIDLVARHWPVESIRDVGSFFRPVWKHGAGRIAGRDYSLDEIEHAILRPMGEPRIHAAIVCASVSCPALRRQPWTAADLDAQLADALRGFLADPDKGLRIDAAEGVIWLSPIFDWFAEDFAARGGVTAFLAPYMPESARSWAQGERRDPPIRLLDYDWNVNALRR